MNALRNVSHYFELGGFPLLIVFCAALEGVRALGTIDGSLVASGVERAYRRGANDSPRASISKARSPSYPASNASSVVISMAGFNVR